MQLDRQLIEEAADFLEGKVRRTPVEPSPVLSEQLGVPVYLKLECLQITGSFKVRGAFFALARYGIEAKGVATCSAGNHGKGLAYAGWRLGVSVTVYVPASVEAERCRAMEAFGARVVRSPYPGYDATEAWAREEAARAGLPFLSAFDDPYVMAGNGGTIAAEVVEDIPDVTTFVVPVGGGGLAAGLAYFVKERRPDTRIFACQLAACPALLRSLEQGRAVTAMPPVATLAGGLEGGLGVQTFTLLRDRVDFVALVEEAELVEAMVWMLDHHQYVIEPSAAVTLAACQSGALPVPEGPVVVIVSGRNVSLPVLRKVLGTGTG